MKLKIWLSALCAFLSFHTSAQVSEMDMEGCADLHMFSRMPNFYLYECSENFVALDLHVMDDSVQVHEGNQVYIEYRFNEGKRPSWLQVTRNYENVILKLGGKKLYSNNELSSYQLINNGKETYIQLYRILNDELDVIHYSVVVLEKELMRQDISANEMFLTLCNAGSIALNILFETGKAGIQPESVPIVDQIAHMMQTNPTLNVRIEGHTDNVGSADLNKKLSQERAHAVTSAIVSRGIDKSRLSAVGWGQERPCSDNESEEGRAKNRRVEIVKI